MYWVALSVRVGRTPTKVKFDPMGPARQKAGLGDAFVMRSGAAVTSSFST